MQVVNHSSIIKHWTKVWIYQRGNQKDRQYNDRKKNDKKRSNDLQSTTQKAGDELRCSRRLSSSCSSRRTRRVTPVANPMISHEKGTDGIVITTNGTYPWSFVTQLFRNGKSCHGDWLQLNLYRKHWFRRFLVDSIPLSKKSWWEPQAL